MNSPIVKLLAVATIYLTGVSCNGQKATETDEQRLQKLGLITRGKEDTKHQIRTMSSEEFKAALTSGSTDERLAALESIATNKALIKEDLEPLVLKQAYYGDQPPKNDGFKVRLMAGTVIEHMNGTNALRICRLLIERAPKKDDGELAVTTLGGFKDPANSTAAFNYLLEEMKRPHGTISESKLIRFVHIANGFHETAYTTASCEAFISAANAFAARTSNNYYRTTTNKRVDNVRTRLDALNSAKKR